MSNKCDGERDYTTLDISFLGLQLTKTSSQLLELTSVRETIINLLKKKKKTMKEKKWK